MRRQWTAHLVLGAVVVLGACAPYGTPLDSEDTTTPDEIVETDIEPIIPSDIELSGESKRRCEIDPKALSAVEIEPNDGFDRGSLRIKQGETLKELPLQETSFESLVVGTVVETTVTQVFGNPFEEAIEAVYTFPLPEDGAVDDYWIRIGDRSIHGIMKRREEARKEYEEAKRNGHSAGLLEQERPNIFTQSVANIAPGEVIEVQMHVVAPLEQEDGRYTMVLPTVVGPRFVPGTPTGKSGMGFAPDTDEVPDGSKITPEVLPPDVHGCAPVSIQVDIETGFGVDELQSKYHAVAKSQADGLASIQLRDGEAIANRDFELSWTIPGDDAQASLMVQPGDEGGYFTLTVQPPPRFEADKAMPRDLIFVVDNSGSMGGIPIETAKAAIHKAIDEMHPDDAFQILRFSEGASGLAPQPLPNTAANRRRGHQYIDAMYGSGGTHMMAGIDAALGYKRSSGRMPVVLFLTDGYIGNESAIFQAIDEKLDGARLFSLGVGSSVNRHLLDGMARMGRGAVTYMGPGEKPDDVVDRFYERIAMPVLTDIEVDWGDLDVQEVTPARIPDLFVGQPLTVFGRFEGEAAGTAILRGKLGKRDVEIPVEVDLAAGSAGTGLSSVWARQRVDDLVRSVDYYQAGEGKQKDRREQATKLALKYRVMTEYTSFIAVDETRVVNPDGTYKTVQVPVEMPQGVSHEGVFGGLNGSNVGTAYGIGGLGLIGTGRGGGGTGSGYGRGAGAGFGGRGKRVPRVRQAKAQITGSIDKDIVRRIVRSHINEVRHCYNQGLANDPNLKGRVAVKFVIDSQGRVTSAEIVSSSLGEDADDVGKCIAKTMRRWQFPKLKGGSSATIVYPFVLEPG